MKKRIILQLILVFLMVAVTAYSATLALSSSAKLPFNLSIGNFGFDMTAPKSGGDVFPGRTYATLNQTADNVDLIRTSAVVNPDNTVASNSNVAGTQMTFSLGYGTKDIVLEIVDNISGASIPSGHSILDCVYIYAYSGADISATTCIAKTSVRQVIDDGNCDVMTLVANQDVILTFFIWLDNDAFLRYKGYENDVDLRFNFIAVDVTVP